MRRTLIATAATLAMLSGAVATQAGAQTTSPTVGNPSSSSSSTSNSAMPDSATKSGSTAGAASDMSLASADEMIGKNVYGRDNNKIGEVEDVILDGSGKAKQLVIGSGGFLGIGEKQVAVDYSAANWDAQNNRLNLAGMSRDDIKALPEFKYDDTMTSLNKSKKSTTSEPAAPGAAPTAGSTSSGTSTAK
ncbi:PRC-barrel domain-containing protein [Azospirillum picis]|uniref:Sporulation protein YlmC with PRC-barrel domain n=1 Tax=Azospirillum picis TaxID=488438 RepID=A0ABU0MIS4_9PROT|nr:PRC-barrel domain-containing protein [Azospirillum picis]MBP2299526.1 sporulation protein YlmC with PRC-barrel domain [Azospirillum picis]MDQ0533347.1 sporulation protein YlmC with PRC-barrel domain [Azospirillum picis]